MCLEYFTLLVQYVNSTYTMCLQYSHNACAMSLHVEHVDHVDYVDYVDYVGYVSYVDHVDYTDYVDY